MSPTLRQAPKLIIKSPTPTPKQNNLLKVEVIFENNNKVQIAEEDKLNFYVDKFKNPQFYYYSKINETQVKYIFSYDAPQITGDYNYFYLEKNLGSSLEERQYLLNKRNFTIETLSTCIGDGNLSGNYYGCKVTKYPATIIFTVKIIPKK